MNWSLLVAYSVITLHAPESQIQELEATGAVVGAGCPRTRLSFFCCRACQVLLAFPVPFHSGTETLEVRLCEIAARTSLSCSVHPSS